MAEKKIVAGFGLEADDAKLDLQRLREAAQGFGDAGENAADALTRTFSNVERSLDNVEKKLSQGRMVTQRDIGVSIQQFTLLERQINETFGSLDKAPAEIQAAFAKVDAQVKTTTRNIGELDDAVKDNAANVKIAGDTWPGLGNAIEGVGGKLGSAAAQAGLFSAALAQGWQMGQQFNQFIGTDMSEWDKVIAKVGAGFKIVFQEMADYAVATGNVIMTALTPGEGYFDRLKQAYSALQEEVSESAKVIGNLGTEIEKETERQKAATEALNKHTDAAKANAAALKDVGDAHVKAFEAAKKLQEETKVEKLKEQIDAMLGLAEATNEVAEANQNAAESAAESASYSDLQVASIQGEIDAVRALLEARGVDLEARQQMKQINLDAGASTEYLLMKERELQASLSAQVTSWTATSTAQTEQKDARAELAAIVEREKAAQEGLTRSVGTVRVEYENGIPVIKNTTDETGKLVGVLENGKMVYTNLDDAQRKATASGISFGENAKNVKQSAAEAAETMAGLATSAGDLATRLADVDKYLDSVNKKMREMKAAAAEAAGDDEAEAKTS